ncbi:hypothetical protein AB1Y20_022359 [Prymnesium parvum]|uniref:Checkpoint protein n=1 Tax=Prymnesium parvum TaxID=97485 RepID=A0AB34JIQ0_PRYPA
MKFKATIGSPHQLSKLVLTLNRLADVCLVRLDNNLISFSTAAEGKDGVPVFGDLAQAMLFLDFSIQSKAENNRICFITKLDNLSRALKSACSTSSSNIKLKLTKKAGTPALTFEIQQADSQVHVVHDVPLRIVQDASEMLPYAEPALSADEGALSVIVPTAEIRGMKNVVERMKSVSDVLLLTASDMSGGQGITEGAGQLKLQVVKDHLVSIATTYPKLDLPHDPTPAAEDADGFGQPIRSAIARLEVKRLLKVLASLSQSDMRICNSIICVVPDKMVVLKVFLPDESQQSSLIFYLSVLSSGFD